ncbi:putative hypothetical protein [Deinococcus grandis]|uniref:Uncharacterized protein n=1 Tax=Deinococcus grandis TaxID=57498 RepID=A0A124BRT1_9DEIO|nr:hypothetical protein [Deinococcus grandis]BBN94379.1 hypothetical protein DEGR_11120 [Deinococcus grandis]GAQ22122.1 putative hypothetical protein [Deinococcus grandis]
MNILNRAACQAALLFTALLGMPAGGAQSISEPGGQIMAALMSGEGRLSVPGSHADACAVLERAGWILSLAGEDKRGRAVRVYREVDGRHSALVWDLNPVQVRVTDGTLALPGGWLLTE